MTDECKTIAKTQPSAIAARVRDHGAMCLPFDGFCCAKRGALQGTKIACTVVEIVKAVERLELQVAELQRQTQELALARRTR